MKGNTAKYQMILSKTVGAEIHAGVTFLYPFYTLYLYIYKGKLPFYEALLNKNGSAPVHHKNIHALADGMFKVTKNLTTKIANDIFYKETKN